MQGLLELEGADARDGGLEVVALLAGDAELVALDRGLHLELGVLDFAEPEKAYGNTLRQAVKLRQGIDRELAKKLAQSIKDSKLKVQASIQGDELRVTGKKRDDLQDAIALVKGLKIEQPLQYVNFRD